VKTSKTSLAAHIAAMFVLSGCAAVSQPVYKVPEENNCTDSASHLCKKFDGIPYVLPRTTLKISLPVIATTTHEGSFFSEAREVFAKENNCEWEENKNNDSTPCKSSEFDKLFESPSSDHNCITNVIQETEKLGLKILKYKENGNPKKKYTLNDTTLSPEAEPDPTQLYYVEVKGGLFEKRDLNITYSDIGILNHIVLEKEDKRTEFLSKTFSSALDALSIALGGRTRTEIENKDPFDEANKVCESSPYKYLVNRAMHTLKYIEVFPGLRNDELKGDRDIGANLKFRLEELDKQYAHARTIFEGTEEKTTKAYEITLRPTKSIETIPLAKFSQSSGICRDDEPSGVMPSTSIPKCQCNKDSSLIKAVFSSPPHLINQKSLATRIHDSLDTVTSKRGIYYRVPETTRVSIKNGDTDLLVQDVPISQYGEVASLPAETGSSNVKYDVTLDPVTGMLRSVVITSSAASTTTGQDFIDPIGKFVKARKGIPTEETTDE